jgi:hypothetical protein
VTLDSWEELAKAVAIITDPGMIARHREWRDLAVRNATTAEKFAAA